MTYMELAKRLRSYPPSRTTFVSLVRVKSKVLIVEEANKQRLKKEKQNVCLHKATSIVQNEVVELRALLLIQS